MRFLRRFLPACVALVTLALAPVAFARAATTRVAATRAATTGGHVTVIVLDMSGSMSENDPLGLRCSAANAYIDLSGANPAEATNDVGVIGLANDNATGPSGGPHGFRLAQIWAEPTATDTTANREALRQAIVTQSHNCAPNGNTPTYDALSKAYVMLSAFLGGNPGLTGSVILLTDGNPDPQGDAQVADVNAEIVPQFVKSGWPVDTIALGTDTNYRGFLSGISAATHGTAYDDSHGPVQGVSPLNLARVFADIFREYEGRALQSSVAPTRVAGTATTQFFIGDAVSHLDVVAIKDTPATTITLTDPNGDLFQPDQQGNFISTDPHYFIFSLEAHPPAPFLQNGPWTLKVQGSGLFLVDSLTVSTLALTITAPASGATLPLGQPVTVSATISANGAIVVDKTYDVEAVITPPGGGTPLRLFLKDPNATGTYSGTFTLPQTAKAGTYHLAATATQGTVSAGQDQLDLTFALFPTPVLLSPTGAPILPTTTTGCDPAATTASCALNAGTATATATGWDGVLQFLYTKVPVLSSPALRAWPLAGYALNPGATVAGEVLTGGQTLYPRATVTASATDARGAAILVVVYAGANGHFTLVFPNGAKGTYTLMLTAAGSPQDAFGNPVVVASHVTVRLSGVPASAQQHAWLVTLFYLAVAALLALFGIYGPINYLLRPKPARSQLVDLSQGNATRSLLWRGFSLRRYFAPNRLPAGQVGLPNNLLFIFGYGNGVTMLVRRGGGKTPAIWKLNGRTLARDDGPQSLTTDAVITLTENGQVHEYRYERLRRGGAKLAQKSPKQKPPKAPKAPRAFRRVQKPLNPNVPVGVP